MLRAARSEDRDQVLAWRNHRVVRHASFTRHVITPDEHAQWWETLMADPSRQLLIFERYGTPSGVVTFEIVTGSDLSPEMIWGYYLDVDGLEARGETLPAWIQIERESLEYAFDDLGANRLVGQVIAENLPVRRLHRRHGIREVATRSRDVDGRSVDFVEIEITRDEWRERHPAASQ